MANPTNPRAPRRDKHIETDDKGLFRDNTIMGGGHPTAESLAKDEVQDEALLDLMIDRRARKKKGQRMEDRQVAMTRSKRAKGAAEMSSPVEALEAGIADADEVGKRPKL